jgi:chromosome segregation ATPase
MIEPIMYFGIGFLVATLIGLIIIPLVHGRAVRLTMRRLEAATPLSMAEIQADKDQLRAEFAMSTRRLEMSVEQLQNRTTAQLAELSRKTDAINRLKAELGEKTATIFALESRDKALRDQLRASEDEFSGDTVAVRDAERALNDKEAELARMTAELDQQSVLTDSQKIEIVALKTQAEALKERLGDAERAVKTADDRVARQRIEIEETTAELAAEHGRVGSLCHRAAELEQQLAAQTTAAEMLGRRAHDLETRLTDQSKALSESEFELRQLREQMNAARNTEGDLRSAIAEFDGKTTSATQTLHAEKARLQAELAHANEERARLAREVAGMKRETEQACSSERAENALLRERINDIAAQVARLASVLEGPNSPIDAILATEAARDGNLADRIRALQSRAPHVPLRGDPTSRN